MQFEIPYNFDRNLIRFLETFKHKDLIATIYVCPFPEDSVSAKSNYISTVHPGIASIPKTRIEYESHVRELRTLGIKLSTMFQNPIHEPTDAILGYYFNTLNFECAIVTRDSLAKRIKLKFPNVYIIGSIVKRCSYDELLNDKLENFDNIVLWFPFNRNIEWIRSLPRNRDYTLLANCTCSPYCDGMHHWFAGDPELSKMRVDSSETVRRLFGVEQSKLFPGENPKNGKCPQHNQADKGIYVPPYLTGEFGKAGITHIKLQGREYPTCDLITDIQGYVSTGIESITSYLGMEMTQLYLQGFEKYYNIGKVSVQYNGE